MCLGFFCPDVLRLTDRQTDWLTPVGGTVALLRSTACCTWVSCGRRDRQERSFMLNIWDAPKKENTSECFRTWTYWRDVASQTPENEEISWVNPWEDRVQRRKMINIYTWNKTELKKKKKVIIYDMALEGLLWLKISLKDNPRSQSASNRCDKQIFMYISIYMCIYFASNMWIRF